MHTPVSCNRVGGVGRPRAKSPEDYAKNAQITVDKGFDAVKINFLTYNEQGKPHSAQEQSAFLSQSYLKEAEKRIKAVRDTVGDKIDIILENHALTDKLSASQYCNMAQKYNILYFEEPTKPDPYLLNYVHRNTGLPIATGERMYTRWEFKRALDQEAVQIIQPDISTAGGVTEVKKICDLAYIYEAGVQIHVCGSDLMTAVSLNLEATLPNFVIHEYNVNTNMPKMLRLTKYDYKPRDGKMAIPNLPGIGNEISKYAFQTGQVVTVG